MCKPSSKFLKLLLVSGLAFATGCSSSPNVVMVRPSSGYQGIQDSTISYDSHGRPVKTYVTPKPGSGQSATLISTSHSSGGSRMSPSALLSQVSVKRDLLPSGCRGRTKKSMRPRYITIHSTQNWSKGADPWRHSLALKNSKLGKLSWHYTVDEKVAVQHLSTTEQGRHADYDGPGNHYSIGIEMCEHPGNSRAATTERTAKLAAWLMKEYDIPLSRVVPHYHWPRYGAHPANKNCPHFLLDNGKPGRKWQGFLAQVKSYNDSITLPQSNAWASR